GTLTPNLRRRVRPARAAITLTHSRIGSRLIMRSVCHSESMPPASHRSTQRQNPATPANGNSIRPSPIATFLGIRSSLRPGHILYHLCQATSARQCRKPSAGYRRVILRCFGAVEHAVIADHPNAPKPDVAVALIRPALGGLRIAP